MTLIGRFRHVVTLEAAGAAVPDGDSGYTEGFAPLDPPEWDCAITQATPRAMERFAPGTVLSQATHILIGRYHAGLTTQCRALFVHEGRTRTLNVIAVNNRDERDMESVLVCAEVVI